MPAGPRSLLEGERLIRKGHYVLAIQRLKGAVELLPENAQAWNHLGLAYHGAGQWTNAIRAYEHALVLSNNLAAARYNLGCVHLEQSNPSAAIEEFKRFTLLQSASAEGWVKLATAQLAARQVDAAEHGYYQALKISSYHPEALNGLGMIGRTQTCPRGLPIICHRTLSAPWLCARAAQSGDRRASLFE